MDISFTVRIDNIGNIRDSYMIDFITDNDWTWRDYGADTIEKIEAGGYANATIFLRTDDLPLQGSYGFRLLIGTTSGIGHQEIPVTVIVRERFDHSISAELMNESIYPSGSTGGLLMVNSSTNGNDIYEISTDVPAGWTIQFGSVRLEASPFQVLPVNFTITAGDEALAGRYTIGIVVSSTGSNNSRTIGIPVFVDEVYGLTWEILGPEDGWTIDPGSTANISIILINGGNIRDRVVISMNSWAVKWMSLKDSTFFIEPGSNFTTQIMVRVPANATPAEINLGISIDSLGSDGSTRNITMEVSDPGRSHERALQWYSFILIVLFAVLMLLIFGGALFANHRRNSGMDVEDAGLEWSEDDEEDEWQE
jgi:uncharacterized membrane protein